MHIFYQPDKNLLYLEREEAQHCVKVLRLRAGDTVVVTDGRGTITKGQLTKVSTQKVEFSLTDRQQIAPADQQIHMAVCPTRKAERNEWMVEKMTELGVHKIQFVVSEHTHRETINRVVNLERLNRIALSAMKQSQQYFLPEIELFSTFGAYLAQVEEQERYIAYVVNDDKPQHLFSRISKGPQLAILIGPEGDFTEDEIEKATSADFIPVSLGDTRLRTETAAVIACHSAKLALEQKVDNNYI